MAMMHTSAIYRSLVFGGVDSSDYGIYITGDGVYNAPERAVEMVSIPGRNGDFALDMGHWENIEITYPAGTFADTQADFADNFAAFRNAIASLTGYQRLEDTYHPDEYRMALFINGVEVEPVRDGRAAQFELKFNAKPQRWLTSGETAITVNSGDTITNPALLDSYPLLVIDGYGVLTMNGYNITFSDDVYADIELPNVMESGGRRYDYDFNYVNSGDFVTFHGPQIQFIISNTAQGAPNFDGAIDIVSNANSIDVRAVQQKITIYEDYSDWTVPAGDETTLQLINTEFTVTSGTKQMRVSIVTDVVSTAEYVALRNPTITVTAVPGKTSFSFTPYLRKDVLTFESITAISTAGVLGEVTYVDCEIGEIYKIVDDTRISLNRYIDIGAELPRLSPGSNSVTYEPTITDLQIVPRWVQL